MLHPVLALVLGLILRAVLQVFVVTLFVGALIVLIVGAGIAALLKYERPGALEDGEDDLW